MPWDSVSALAEIWYHPRDDHVYYGWPVTHCSFASRQASAVIRYTTVSACLSISRTSNRCPRKLPRIESAVRLVVPASQCIVLQLAVHLFRNRQQFICMNQIVAVACLRSTALRGLCLALILRSSAYSGVSNYFKKVSFIVCAHQNYRMFWLKVSLFCNVIMLSLIHIWRCRRRG